MADSFSDACTLGTGRRSGNGAPPKCVLQPLQDRVPNIVAMDSLGFDDLRLFSRVAALGTLSAVARERDVPVSQVSRSLSRIEKACGARLIHRSTHGLALTAEGQTLSLIHISEPTRLLSISYAVFCL